MRRAPQNSQTATLASRPSGDAKSLTFSALAPAQGGAPHGHPSSVRAHEGHETRYTSKQERKVTDDTGTDDPGECAARKLAAAREIRNEPD